MPFEVARSHLRQKLVAERFAGNCAKLLDDLELTIGEGLSDEDVVHEVMIVLHGDFTGWAFELLADEGRADFIDSERAGLLDGLFQR